MAIGREISEVLYDPSLPHVERVIKYIKEQLYEGVLHPGARLIAERKMAEQLGVSRVHVRAALKKLECYGIVKTFPQSGTVVSQLKVQALESMITNILKIDSYDFRSLVEVRVILEAQAMMLCARNRTENDLSVIREALAVLEDNFNSDERVDADFAYHQAIVQGSHNPVLASMLLIITPDILNYYIKYNACSVPEDVVVYEHREMLRCIEARDEEGVREILLRHLSNILEFARTNNHENHYLH